MGYLKKICKKQPNLTVMKKNLAKNKKFNTNQKSFFFEDYFETNLKNKKKKSFLISEDDGKHFKCFLIN